MLGVCIHVFILEIHLFGSIITFRTVCAVPTVYYETIMPTYVYIRIFLVIGNCCMIYRMTLNRYKKIVIDTDEMDLAMPLAMVGCVQVWGYLTSCSRMGE